MSSGADLPCALFGPGSPYHGPRMVDQRYVPDAEGPRLRGGVDYLRQGRLGVGAQGYPSEAMSVVSALGMRRGFHDLCLPAEDQFPDPHEDGEGATDRKLFGEPDVRGADIRFGPHNTAGVLPRLVRGNLAAELVGPDFDHRTGGVGLRTT